MTGYIVSKFTCPRCGEETRYRHTSAECVMCGETFCRQKKTAKWCSRRCQSAHTRGTSPARIRVATNVTAFRRNRGWSQADLRERLTGLGVQLSKASMSALERSADSGRSATFPADLVAALAQALEVTPNDLYGWETSTDSYGTGYRDGRRSALADIVRLATEAEESR